MALPLSGPLSLNDIRIEQNQSTKSPYSLIGASTSAAGYSIVNQDSFFKPNSTPPYSISEWYGYSAFTISWSNISNTKLDIYVNNILTLSAVATIGGVFDVNLNDTLPKTQSGGNPISAAINRLRNAFLPTGAIPNVPRELMSVSQSVSNIDNSTYVPTKITIQINLLPIQTRNQQSQQFSVKGFANGDLLKGGFW